MRRDTRWMEMLHLWEDEEEELAFPLYEETWGNNKLQKI